MKPPSEKPNSTIIRIKNGHLLIDYFAIMRVINEDKSLMYSIAFALDMIQRRVINKEDASDIINLTNRMLEKRKEDAE